MKATAKKKPQSKQQLHFNYEKIKSQRFNSILWLINKTDKQTDTNWEIKERTKRNGSRWNQIQCNVITDVYMAAIQTAIQLLYRTHALHNVTHLCFEYI